MIRIAIAEDDPLFQKQVENNLERYMKEQNLRLTWELFPDGAALLSNYRPIYDILLLDIQMPSVDGMTAARRIRETDESVIIIFLTSMPQFAIEGYCEALRLEIRGFGINVTTIEPGDFATAFTAQRKSVDNPAVHQAYPGYARSLASIEHDENSGLKPEFLANKISKIILKKRPGYHYIIATFLQKLSVFARTILPPRWFAWVMSVYYKL